MKIALQHNHFRIWIVAFIIGTLAGCATLPNTSNVAFGSSTISVANHSGSTPTVVFQSGLGDGMSVWSDVIKRLPPDLGTFAYDRPGYGGSPNTRRERDPCSVAMELHELLRTLNVRPPYILVGHSLGGLYQYAFAKLYPDEVSGILLVDATHPEHWEYMQRRTPEMAKVLRGLRAIAFSETEKQEFDAQAMCLPDLRAKATPSIPARLLRHGESSSTESAEFQAMSNELAARWPELLPGMTIFRVEGTGHYIQKDRPDVVANEIDALVSTAHREHGVVASYHDN